MAFEYQGPHHDEQASIQATDALKRKACRAHGVTLIEVPTVKRPFPPQNLHASVAASLATAQMDKRPRLPKGELFQAELAELESVAADRGGTLVSERYFGGERHEWKCAVPEHATWLAEPWRIRRGAWCPSCAGNRKLEIRDLRAWGRRHRLRLLDRTYLGSQRVYSWRCVSCGHLVRRSKGNIDASLRKGRAACSMCNRGNG